MKAATTRRRIAASLAGAMAIGVAWLAPGTAAGAVTVGSDLQVEPRPDPLGCVLSTPPCTLLADVAARGGVAASPVNGKVTQFGIRTSAPEEVTFRIGRLVTGGIGNGAGVATGPNTNVGAGTSFIPANERISIGDLIGIDTSLTTAMRADDKCSLGGHYYVYHPVLSNPGTGQAPDANGSCELLVNARVKPDTGIRLVKTKLNKRKGFARLSLDLDNPGKLVAKGKGVKRATKTATKDGSAKLKIRPKGTRKRQLKQAGKVTLWVKVAYKALGADKRRTLAKRVTLKQK